MSAITTALMKKSRDHPYFMADSDTIGKYLVFIKE